MKHWIQALLEEDPCIPYPYFYDVVDLVVPAPARPRRLRLPDEADVPGHPDDGDRTGPKFGTAPGRRSPVYAFDTDSCAASAS